MDAYQQQHHRYMRPPQQPQPPPSTSDPHQYQHYQHQQRPPVPPQGSWYSNQFQYQPPPSSHSPSPPPPHHWGAPPPPPPPPSASPYPPPSHPYSSHLPPQNHHFPPPPAPPPQSYPQEWGNPNWGQHQAWDYTAQNNSEDWAARARAWAAAKQVATDDQHQQAQFTPGSRPEDQSHYQYPQAGDHYQDVQLQAFPASGYQQFPASASAPPHQAPMVYTQENAPFSSGHSSYGPEGHQPYGSSAGVPTTGSFVHQQEVPSSYSSVTGNSESANQNDQLHKSLPLPISQTQEGQFHLQPSLPPIGRSVLIEEPFTYGNQAADTTTDLSDQPLVFASSFSHNHDPHMQSNYAAPHDSAGTIRGIGSSTSMPSINSWTPAVTSGAVYPQISSVLSSGPQHDPSIAVPSPVSGHTSSAFGSFPVPNFQPTVPPTAMPYGLGAGAAIHPTAGFPGDAYGVSSVSERPKKASVPNWLKEEIIKKASVMSRPPLEHTQEETQSFEEEGVGKSFGKGDLIDSKSIDSSRSTEEEEEDEDYAEATRTAAINQEIKRILTEVLLKVTDELFDEIATKVLDEDDLTVEGELNTVSSNPEVSSSPVAVPTAKASATVLVPVKAKESDNEHVNETSSSSSPGNILGLVSYASDEDDDEIQSNEMSNSRNNAQLQQSSTMKVSESMHDTAVNGVSRPELGKHSKETKLESDVRKTSSVVSNNNLNATSSESNEHENSLGVVSGSRDIKFSVDGGKRGSNMSGLKITHEDSLMESEPLSDNVSMKKIVADDFGARETRTKLNQDNKLENRSHSAKEFVKEGESRSRADKKVDDNHPRQDERHQRKDKKDDRNGSKDRKNERGDDKGEKAMEAESRKRTSNLAIKKDKKEVERSHRDNAKEDNDRKRERTKDKDEDRARHKPSSDSSKHKRRRSSSISSRGRNSKDNDSSDEASHDSKRKQHSRKRHSSPSPVRSRRRQVSRSPHSKHSQRRHSPYSSLESNRGRRSRSKSPVRRRR